MPLPSSPDRSVVTTEHIVADLTDRVANARDKTPIEYNLPTLARRESFADLLYLPLAEILTPESGAWPEGSREAEQVRAVRMLLGENAGILDCSIGQLWGHLSELGFDADDKITGNSYSLRVGTTVKGTGKKTGGEGTDVVAHPSYKYELEYQLDIEGGNVRHRLVNKVVKDMERRAARKLRSQRILEVIAEPEGLEDHTPDDGIEQQVSKTPVEEPKSYRFIASFSILDLVGILDKWKSVGGNKQALLDSAGDAELKEEYHLALNAIAILQNSGIRMERVAEVSFQQNIKDDTDIRLGVKFNEREEDIDLTWIDIKPQTGS